MSAEALDAIDQLTTFGEKRLRSMPKGTPARREMLIEARDAYVRLLESRRDDRMRLQTAIAHRRVAFIESELGHGAEALAAGAEALALLDEIGDEMRPVDLQLERALVHDIVSQVQLTPEGSTANAIGYVIPSSRITKIWPPPEE